MSKTDPESPKEFREYCRSLYKANRNYEEYRAYWRRLVCIVVLFLFVICGLNVWLFYKG